MERTDFTKPIHVTTWMGVVLALVAILAAFLVPQLKFAFLANPLFNSVILVVFAVGVLINLTQVWRLQREVLWVESFHHAGPDAPHATKPVMLRPLAKLLSAREHHRPRLSATSMRSVLDGVQIRLEEQRDISRYVIGALIFLGLLGTFWGLLITVRSVSEIIAGMSGGSNAIEMFDTLKEQLDGPLAGMVTSFSCSLFGLAGSLVVGFLDLNVGHAQNRFYNELDQWLSGFVEQAQPAVLAGDSGLSALLAHTAASLERVERSTGALETIAPRLEQIAEQLDRDADTPATSETGEEIRDLLRQINERPSDSAQLSEDVRAELRLMTRAIAGALGGGKDKTE